MTMRVHFLKSTYPALACLVLALPDAPLTASLRPQGCQKKFVSSVPAPVPCEPSKRVSYFDPNEKAHFPDYLLPKGYLDVPCESPPKREDEKDDVHIVSRLPYFASSSYGPFRAFWKNYRYPEQLPWQMPCYVLLPVLKNVPQANQNHASKPPKYGCHNRKTIILPEEYATQRTPNTTFQQPLVRQHPKEAQRPCHCPKNSIPQAPAMLPTPRRRLKKP